MGTERFEEVKRRIEENDREEKRKVEYQQFLEVASLTSICTPTAARGDSSSQFPRHGSPLTGVLRCCCSARSRFSLLLLLLPFLLQRRQRGGPVSFNPPSLQVVSQHKKLLELTVYNCDLSIRVIGLIEETVAEACSAIKARHDRTNQELGDLRLEIHKEYLEFFRMLYLTLGVCPLCRYCCSTPLDPPQKLRGTIRGMTR